MKSDVTVVGINKFISKKGNPCAFIFVSENNGIPFRVLVFDKDQLNKPVAVGDVIELSTSMDNNMFGTLKLTW